MAKSIVGTKLNEGLAQFFQNRTVQHLLFWTLSYYLLFLIFNSNDKYIVTDLIYTFLFHLSLVGVVYLNLRWLLPRFFRSKQYLAYALGFGLVLGLGAVLNHLTFQYLSDWIFPGYYFISYYEWQHILQFVASYMVLSSLLHLSRSWFVLNEKDKAINRLEREKLDAELQSLKAQVNPHFLFNNLNNLYALSLDQDARLPNYLLGLSENLRYMLYECGGKLVPLSRELIFLSRYVDLQKLRAPKRAEISFEIEGEPGDRSIAPLLFIPFVENAFKFGLKGRNENAYARIHFLLEADRLVFTTRNSKGMPDHTPQDSGGIGIKNTRQRLALLYPHRHKLVIEDEAAEFIVHLEISYPHED